MPVPKNMENQRVQLYLIYVRFATLFPVLIPSSKSGREAPDGPAREDARPTKNQNVSLPIIRAGMSSRLHSSRRGD